MWIIAKIKNNEIETFKKTFQEKLKENIDFYIPKMEIHKKIFNKSTKKKINLIGNYIFCYNKNFSSDLINRFSFLKGLKYFFKNCEFYQKDIEYFIENCKGFENKDGIIAATLFSKLDKKNFKFLNGPLAEVIFNIAMINSKYIFGTLKNNKRIVIRNFNNYST